MMRLIYRLLGLESGERARLDSVKKLSVPKMPKMPDDSSAEKLLEYIRKSHWVDDISVFTEEGTLIATTLEPEEAMHELSVFEQVRYEFEDADHMIIKERGGWIIMFARNGKIYSIHAPSTLNLVETAIIARDVEKLLFGVGW